MQCLVNAECFYGNILLGEFKFIDQCPFLFKNYGNKIKERHELVKYK